MTRRFRSPIFLLVNFSNILEISVIPCFTPEWSWGICRLYGSFSSYITSIYFLMYEIKSATICCLLFFVCKIFLFCISSTPLNLSSGSPNSLANIYSSSISILAFTSFDFSINYRTWARISYLFSPNTFEAIIGF